MIAARHLPFVILIASVGALGTAFTAQYWGGLQPCVLCLYQRWPYAITILLGLIGIWVAAPTARAAIIALAGLAFLAGAGIAAFHVGVEQGWWQGTTQCGTSGTPATLEELRAQILAAPVVRCTDIAWSLFGISMAGFNVIASLILAAVSLTGAARLARTA